MKKKIAWAILAISVLMCFNVEAQTVPGLKPANLSFIIGTAGYTNDKFATIGGALTLGTQIIVDREMNFSVRAEYDRINVGAPDLQYLNMSGVWYWYLGEKYNFSVNPGVSVGVSDGAGNPIFLGFGIERLMFKFGEGSVPFYGALYASANFTESTSEIRVGLRISKPEK
jgi:hypothetical protein